MGWTWTLSVCLAVVCSAAPGLSQDPSDRTLFVLTGPEVLHAGTPTSLAVTVLSDLPVRVIAEVAHDNVNVAQTEDVQEGRTGILTLPPIPAFTAQSSLVNLTVRGYQGENLIFSNTTSLRFSLRNVSSFIHTDRPRYRPGDTVRVRTVSVRLDNLPYKGRVDVSVQDPSGTVVNRWESAGDLGIALREFTLSQRPLFGQWAVTLTVNGVTDVKTFTVEQFEPPHFEVLVKVPSRVLVGDDISGSVRATYPSGQPVRGTLAVSLTQASVTDSTQTKEIYGSAQFFFRGVVPQNPLAPAVDDDGHVVYVTACVTDKATGFKVNRTLEVHLEKETFQLKFYDVPVSLKPSLHFFTKLRISRYDRKPLSPAERLFSAVVDVSQSASMKAGELTTLTLPVPEDGSVHIKFTLEDQVEVVFIRARFQSSAETLVVYNNYSSPSGSYIQLSPTLPAQIGLALQINVESTFKLPECHVVVSSRGQVVSAQTLMSSSFSLIPTLSWSPEACVTIYCVLSDTEVVTDTAHVPIDRHDHVSLRWSRDKAQPGERVSLTVTVLEPKSHVGIMVTGTHGDAPRADLVFREEQVCNIRMTTNVRQHTHTPVGKTEADDLTVEKYWTHWKEESLLWLDANVSDKTWTSEGITVPDGVTSLRAVALIMSTNLGLGFTPVPKEKNVNNTQGSSTGNYYEAVKSTMEALMTADVPHPMIVSKDFSLSLNVPSYLIRGEELVLEVHIVNHLERDIEVIVLLSQSEAFEFVLAERGDASVVNAQKLLLGSHVSALALFPIRPVALGEMEMSVDAISAESSDSLVWRVPVKPEGVEQLFSETLFLELAPMMHNGSKSISFSFPPNVVAGSQRAHVALVGDVLGLSLTNLDSLVQRPLGCGEQNMIHFAPSVYVLQYLDRSNQDHQEMRSRALAYMTEGYRRQLYYRRDDGSFSAFGASDSSGSTWLTAFVLRCFLQAQPFMLVEQSVLVRALTWLVSHQGPQGDFSEVGVLIHTEMQGGLDHGGVALTAYVTMALLEDKTYAEMFPGNVSMAQKYLESSVSSGAVSNYSLCLAAYALTLAGSPAAGRALAELKRRADYRDGAMMWGSSAGLESHGWQPRSAHVEMAAYVMLAFIHSGNFVEGITLMKWLSRQRNHLGSFGTTQDTVVALQALAYYAAYSGASAIDLRLRVSDPASSSSSLFHINSTSYLTYQRQEIKADEHIHLNIDMKGRGFAMFQLNVFYNMESNAFSLGRLRAAAGAEAAFDLNVGVIGQGDPNHMLISVCTRLKSDQVIARTGMAIVDIGLLSGFRPPPGAAAPTHLIRKVEILPEKVSLYLDSLNKSEVCVRLPVIRVYKMSHVRDVVVQVYDYYEPTRRAATTYNADILHDIDVCSFCGEDCDRCRPGVSIMLSSLSSHATGSATCRLWVISFGIVSLFIVVELDIFTHL